MGDEEVDKKLREYSLSSTEILTFKIFWQVLFFSAEVA